MKTKKEKVIEAIKEIAVLKTICFNLRMFDLKTAIKLPVLIGRKTNIKHAARGSIILPENVKPGLIKIGIGGTYGVGWGGRTMSLSVIVGSLFFRGKQFSGEAALYLLAVK